MIWLDILWTEFQTVTLNFFSAFFRSVKRRIRKGIHTYHTTLFPSPILLPLLQVSNNRHLNLGIVVLISVFLVRYSLLSHLLVIHGVLSLVDRVGA